MRRGEVAGSGGRVLEQAGRWRAAGPATGVPRRPPLTRSVACRVSGPTAQPSPAKRKAPPRHVPCGRPARRGPPTAGNREALRLMRIRQPRPPPAPRPQPRPPGSPPAASPGRRAAAARRGCPRRGRAGRSRRPGTCAGEEAGSGAAGAGWVGESRRQTRSGLPGGQRGGCAPAAQPQPARRPARPPPAARPRAHQSVAVSSRRISNGLRTAWPAAPRVTRMSSSTSSWYTALAVCVWGWGVRCHCVCVDNRAGRERPLPHSVGCRGVIC